jgi:acyl-CoA thioesterase-1
MDSGMKAGLSLFSRRAVLAAAAACAAPLTRAATPATILVLGDSLSAEYGLRRGTGWVTLLEKRLAQEKIDARVVNASISGETTSGGRSRLAALLAQHKPTHVVIELGANDALRGLSVAMTEANLTQMTQASQKAGAQVLLVGIQLPPNFGPAYGEKFAQMYVELGRKLKTGVVPFILKGVADIPDAEKFFQTDRTHPTEQAQPRILDNVWPELRKLLK